MAEPTKKSEGIESPLTQLTGTDRRQMIRENRCLPAPVGCGGPAVEFRDEISKREYSISGLCQNCQDSIFGGGEDDETGGGETDA